MNVPDTICNRKSAGVVLLEVLMALTLFVISAAVVGSAMRASMQATVNMRFTARAADIAQSVLAELLAGSAELVDTPATAFEDAPEGWTYQIVTEEVVDTPGLKKVTVIVADADSPDSRTHQLTQWILDRTALTERSEESGL